MDLDQFLSSVFPSKDQASIATPRRLLEYSSLQEHIDEILAQYDDAEETETALSPEERALTDGRIGPKIVCIDTNSLCGSMNIKDGIEIESQSNFSSARANVCVCKGKWMYEILLGSKGIMQLGWSTINCKFTNEEGVGDTQDSFAYDGHRVRKWNVATAKYGEEWMAGDVIGCCIDMDKGEISYSRNGMDLGVAFDNVQFGAGLAYFPAVSLSYGESCQLNFGAFPLKFPMPDFKPLQGPPSCAVAKATELMACLDRLLPSPSRIATMPASLHSRVDTLTLLTTAHVFEKLGPLLTEGYTVEVVLLPFLLKSCSGENPLANERGAQKILDLMWVCMEPSELEPCLEHLLGALIKAYWFHSVTLDFKIQGHCLCLALNILRHERTRRVWMKCKIFPQKFSYFMHIKPPDDSVLKTSFPAVWWESKDEFSRPSDAARTEYQTACQALRNKVQVLESVQVEMCKILLQNDDAVPSQGFESSRTVFLEKFRKFLHESMMVYMTVQPSSACVGPVITCFYHRLVQALRWHWDQWARDSSAAISTQDAYVPSHVFYDESIQYWDLSRLGGLLSHLKRTCPASVKDIVQKKSRPAGSSARDESAEPDSSLVEMLDNVVLMYHIAVHKQLSKVRALRENMQQNIKALEDTMAKIRRCSAERADVMVELERAKRVFLHETTSCARHMAWVSSLIFTEEKQGDIHWMLQCIMSSVERAAKCGPLFEFTPEFYIDATINAFHGLRLYFHPTANFKRLPDAQVTLEKLAAFLCTQFVDQRIINPDLRDVIIQTLAAFVCYEDSLKAIENIAPALLEKTVRCLMSAYDKRLWVQTTWILVRTWKGCGFAFRYGSQDFFTVGLPEQGHLRANLQPPHPSRKIQELIGRLCLEDDTLTNEFLNGMLNQLNWAFSEFIGMLQEIQQATNRMETVLDTRQLRTCAVCFDLTVGLLRVLEMVASVSPEVFTDWKRTSAELQIARLFQMLTQALNRVTASSNLFENVTKLHLPGLETVDRFPILGAVTGILLALLRHGSRESKERATSSLLVEPGFALESVEFLIGAQSGAALSGKTNPQPPFSFQNLSKDVSPEEVRSVDELIAYLAEQSAQAQLQKQESVDVDDLCPICYAIKKSVRFVPCRHESCRSCISRHLMNHKECFFCKERVEEMEDI